MLKIIVALSFFSSMTLAGTSPTVNACDGLAGSKFESLNDHETGENLQGIVYGKWTVAFDSQKRVSYRHSDVVTQGSYQCSGSEAEILYLDIGAQVLSNAGAYNKDLGILFWEGKWYKKIN